MPGTEQELSTITKVKKRKGEPVQEYFARLAEGARNIPDRDWESLSTDAQAWVNAATKAQDDTPPSLIAGFEPEPSDDEAPAPESAATEEANEMATNGNVETKSKKKAVKAKTAKKAPRAAKAKAEKAPRTVSARRYLKEAIIKNPKMSIEELSDKLAKAGHKLSELSLLSIIRDTQNTLQIANELGLYKRDV